MKKILKIALIVGSLILAGYGAYKVYIYAVNYAAKKIAGGVAKGVGKGIIGGKLLTR